MNRITTEDLRRMEGREGLILQGCGGDIQEWVDGINGLLTTEGILLNGSRFENVSVFQHRELTNLLFPFEGVELNAGRLAMWRLRTHEQFGGTWLSSSQSPLNFVSALRRKLRSLPCSSSPHRNRFAGLRRGP